MQIHPSLEYLGLTVLPHESREYVLSNHQRMHWTGESNKSETRKWQGLVKDRWTTLTNFWLDVNNTCIDSSDLISSIVYPHAIHHIFQHGAIQYSETAWIVRNEDILVVEYCIDSPKAVKKIAFRPQFGLRKDLAASVGILEDFRVYFSKSTRSVYISNTNPSYNGSRFVGIRGSVKLIEFIAHPQIIPRNYVKDEFRGDGSPIETIFEPGSLLISSPGKKEYFYIVIALGSSLKEIDSNLSGVLENISTAWTQTQQYLCNLINDLGILTSNETWNHALLWAVLSLDNLTMSIHGRGIYAGLHWFPEYWGRDLFIALPGALLTIGQFEMAKAWIRTMANYQNRDPKSKYYGRVPNILSHGENTPNYETADGTGWFIRAIWELFQYNGEDLAFLKEIFPSIVTAIQGELQRCDRLGFLTHGDRETWMDAMTNGIVCSPRGNRAVEIQALWYTELDIGIRFAQRLGDTQFVIPWQTQMQLLKQNFFGYFYNADDEDLYDHLNRDDSPDVQKRPNEIFAVTIPLPDNLLLPESIGDKIVHSVIKHTVTSHGVRTLAETDPDFHPLHDHGSRSGIEHHDFSYHNGDVWLWLSSFVSEAAFRITNREIPRRLTDNMVTSILTRNTCGTLGEIMDGTDTDPLGHSRGTISQAWSLAEFLRFFYQGWLGIHPDAINHILQLEPKIPADFSFMKVKFRIQDIIFTLAYKQHTDFLSGGSLTIRIELSQILIPYSLQIRCLIIKQKKEPVVLIAGRMITPSTIENDVERALYIYTFNNLLTTTIQLDISYPVK